MSTRTSMRISVRVGISARVSTVIGVNMISTMLIVTGIICIMLISAISGIGNCMNISIA